MSADPRRCRTTSRTTSRPAKVEPFISFKLPELLRFTDTDFDQCDALAGRPDGLRLWWHLRRLEWAEQDQEAEV